MVYLYDDEDGNRKQKWETFKTPEEGKRLTGQTCALYLSLTYNTGVRVSELLEIKTDDLHKSE